MRRMLFVLKKTWCGIVDGRYRHEALKQPITKNGSCSASSWTVAQVESIRPMKRYRQFARMQNMRHAPNFYIQITSADVLYSHEIECDELKLKGGKVTAAMVASAYRDDSQYGSASL